MRPTLRIKDGFGTTTPQLRKDVVALQTALARKGYPVGTDGLFGKGTEKAVRAFQRDRGLGADGVVGPATWRALVPAEGAPVARQIDGFATFHGDLSWVHDREGHNGRPYWPGGASGVTLDPGFDLAHQTIERTRELYGKLIDATQSRALSRVIGVRGKDAGQAVSNESLQSIRVSRAAALRVMPHVAVKYWTAIARRFPMLAADDAPPSVQTALLSLAYNRGARNRGLEPLGAPLAARRWLEVADRLGEMQQDHSLRGIRIRRRQEADLIRAEVDFA